MIATLREDGRDGLETGVSPEVFERGTHGFRRGSGPLSGESQSSAIEAGAHHVVGGGGRPNPQDYLAGHVFPVLLGGDADVAFDQRSALEHVRSSLRGRADARWRSPVSSTEVCPYCGRREVRITLREQNRARFAMLRP